MYLQHPHYQHLTTIFLLLASLLINATLAQFTATRAAKFNTDFLWKGTPEVRFPDIDRWYMICDDNRWNMEVATAFCYHRGFVGVMVMDTMSLNSPIRHASCLADYSSTPPLFCQEITQVSCSQVPRISCLLPGYHGCYYSTNANPYFTVTPPQQMDMTLQDCGRDCYNLGYAFFGVEDRVKCRCADQNTPTQGEELTDAACQQTCQGDADQYCGGNDAMSVYEASLGQCDLRISIEDGDTLYFTSERFPAKYSPGSSCQDELVINLTNSGLTIWLNYRLDDEDLLGLYSENLLMNMTIVGPGSGLETFFFPDPYELGTSINLDFQSHSSSTGGSFLVYFFAELPDDQFSSSSSLVPETPPPQTASRQPPQPPQTTMALPEAAPANLGLYIGVGVAAAVVIILIIAIVSVCLTARRNRSKPAAGGNVAVNSATNVAYNIDNDRVNTSPKNAPTTAPHSADDFNRYATIEGEYYYAPTNGPQPPLPKPRDAPQPANEYEELPADSAGTPYQSLTKSDREAYQELIKDQGPEYTTLQPSGEYLEPI